MLPRVSRVPSITVGLAPGSCRLRPRTRPGKMLHFDFCNRLAYWHVHQPNRSTLEVTQRPPSLRRAFHARPTEPGVRPLEAIAGWSRRTARVSRCLTTPLELRSSSFTLRVHQHVDDGCGPILRVLDRGTLGPHPQAAALSSRGLGRAPLPLTPLRRRRSTRRCFSAAGFALPRAPVKDRGSCAPGRLPSTDVRLAEDHQARAWCSSRTRHRREDFAALRRLPTLFRGPDAPVRESWCR